jgi:hypothetical protein
MSLSSATFFGTSTALSANHKVQAGPTGNITGNALTFAQTPKTNGGQDITFTFTAPIYELSFIITDIDNGLTGDGEAGDEGFSERVVILPSGGYTSTVPTGSTVTGAGTAASPFMNSNVHSYHTDSPGGNLKISMAGPISTFTIKFSNGSIQNGSSERIHLTNISFKGASSCAGL